MRATTIKPSSRVVLGARLRNRRLSCFMTQAELAQASGVHETSIIRLEAARSAANFATIRRLAAALGLDDPKVLAYGDAPELPANAFATRRTA